MKKESAGKYTCRATNEFGFAESTTEVIVPGCRYHLWSLSPASFNFGFSDKNASGYKWSLKLPYIHTLKNCIIENRAKSQKVGQAKIHGKAWFTPVLIEQERHYKKSVQRLLHIDRENEFFKDNIYCCFSFLIEVEVLHFKKAAMYVVTLRFLQTKALS